MDFRVGFGYDSHRLATGLPLRLGGITIPAPFGCVAHSDGDAVIHALCDALFGAAGLADIGSHFPDSDPTYRGADSTQLLEKTVAELHQLGWKINNVDITIVLEQPKLTDFKHLMRNKLATIMQVNEAVVSVKAKSNEKMGFVGSSEGVAVTVAASIVQF